MAVKLELGGSRKSLDRPAWTSDNLFAFRHKHTIVRGKFQKIINFYHREKRG